MPKIRPSQLISAGQSRKEFPTGLHSDASPRTLIEGKTRGLGQRRGQVSVSLEAGQTSVKFGAGQTRDQMHRRTLKVSSSLRSVNILQ